MFIRRGSAILRSPDPDPGAGGGGGADSGFNEAQQAAIGKIVNSAISSHMGRIDFSAKVAEGLKAVKWGEVLAEPVKALLEQKPQADDDDPAKPGKGGKASKGGDSALEAQLQKLAGDLETERAARKAAEMATTAAEQKRLLDGATTNFRNGLQPKLRPELLDVAVGHFGTALKVDDKGIALLRVKKAPYKGAPEEDMDVPLIEGLPILLASEGMKPFLPAPGGNNGNGGRKGGNPGGGNGAPALDSKDPLERARARLAGMGIDLDNEING